MFVPQLLEEKNQQNLEFPKYHIVNTPPPLPRQFRTLLENRDETTLVCMCVVGGGGWHPLFLAHRVYPYNLVGQILKIFECLTLKSNSGRKKW
jgi:hypothetical protein